MKIAILTVDEVFYLPTEVAYLMRHRHEEDEYRVFIVPPEHYDKVKKKREKVALRVLRSFGLRYFLHLAIRGLAFKVLQYLPRDERSDRFYSIDSVGSAFGVPVQHIANVNSERTIQMLSEWGVDLTLSLSCPQVFRKGIIDASPNGVLNLHCSPLPRYRGLYPAFWQLKNGENEAGATIFFVNKQIDGGDILIQRCFPIESDETLDHFVKRSKRIGTELIVEGIEKIRCGDVDTRPIDIDAGSYFTWPTREAVREFQKSRRLI